MEYLEGDDLGTVLGDDSRLGWTDALSITRQICQSLAEAHRQGVIHRDLKPDNVFLTRTPTGGYRVKVLDFGIAKLVDGVDGNDAFFQTQDGAMMGTPYFMSPEQFDGVEVDSRADLYAVGALLYRMLTGWLPYSGRSFRELMEQHRTGHIPDFRSVCPELELPDGIEAMVRQLMATERTARFQSAEAVIGEIDAFLSNQSGLNPADLGSTQLNLIRRDSTGASNEARDIPPQTVVHESGQFTMGDVSASGGPVYLERSTLRGRERDSSDRYARQLRRRRWLAPALLGFTIVGAGFFLWSLIHQNAPPLTVEKEPNDLTSDANVLTPGYPVKGHIGRRTHPHNSDRDIYLVTVPAKETGVQISVTGVPLMDVVVDVFSFEGELLARLNQSAAGGGEEGYVGTRGTRMLQVCVREVWVEGQTPRENSTDAYTLKADFVPPPPPKGAANPS